VKTSVGSKRVESQQLELPKKELIAIVRGQAGNGEAASMVYQSGRQGLKAALLEAVLGGATLEQALPGKPVEQNPGRAFSLHVAARVYYDPPHSPAQSEFYFEMRNQDARHDVCNLAVTFLMSAGMEFVKASGPRGYSLTGQEVRFAAVKLLEPDAREEYFLQVRTHAADTPIVANIVWDEFPRLPVTR
jgi:hypothetical protein